MDDLLTRHKQLEASYRSEGPEPDMTRYGTVPSNPNGICAVSVSEVILSSFAPAGSKGSFICL